jgi:hypothetical protein
MITDGLHGTITGWLVFHDVIHTAMKNVLLRGSSQRGDEVLLRHRKGDYSTTCAILPAPWFTPPLSSTTQCIRLFDAGSAGLG